MHAWIVIIYANLQMDLEHTTASLKKDNRDGYHLRQLGRRKVIIPVLPWQVITDVLVVAG
jgi:hypothetical protein